jgi:hypothetical protein
MLLSLIIPTLLLSACGGGARVIKPRPVVKQAQAVPTRSADPLEGFKGERHKPGEIFVLANNPRAIVGPSLILRLVRIDWAISESGRGVVEKEGTAHIVVESGDLSKTLRLDEGESRGAFGWRVHLSEVNDLFREGQGDYVPQATIKVTRDN